MAAYTTKASGGFSLDVRYLNYFLALAKEKNMTRAAKKLYVSQSSLSQYLSKLEQEVGTALFYRSKGELNLTPAGKLYESAASQVIDIQKNLYHEISGLSKKGHITVGATSLFALKMLSEIIPKFKGLYPQVTIEISESSAPELMHLLSEEQIDFGIMALANQSLFTENTEILRTEEVLFAVPKSHPFCQIHALGPVTYPELEEYFKDSQFLLSKKESSLRILAEQVFSSCGFSPSSMCETNSVLTLRDMVADSAGVTFLAASCCEYPERISYYSLSPRLTRFSTVSLRKNLIMNEAEQCFYGLIKDYFREG